MFRFTVFLILSVFILSACNARQENTCETDRINGDWGDIVDNENCSNTERAEAYLALGGFNYFKFIGDDDPDLIEILGLNESNWETKKGYFDAAISLVENMATGTQKTIYLLASYLGLFTHVSGNLDNGAGSATAFDGDIEEVEQTRFTGSDLDSSSGSQTSELTPTDNYQIRIVDGTQYYVIDSASLTSGPPYNIYLDNDGDGSGDEKISDTEAIGVVSSMSDPGIAELNQVTQMDSLSDPFSSSDDLNISSVNAFADDILQYILKIQAAIEALNVDASEDVVEQVENFRLDLDNGGVCGELEDNPSILLVQYFASSLQETAITDYSDVNRLSASRLQEYGADASFDSNDLSSTYSVEELGVKVLFKVNGSSNYISYWSDSTTEIKNTLEVFKNFDDNELEAGDNKIVFSEVICASDLMSD